MRTRDFIIAAILFQQVASAQTYAMARYQYSKGRVALARLFQNLAAKQYEQIEQYQARLRQIDETE